MTKEDASCIVVLALCLEEDASLARGGRKIGRFFISSSKYKDDLVCHSLQHSPSISYIPGGGVVG